MLQSLYVGNLPYSVTDSELKKFFIDLQLTVNDAYIIRDKQTKNSRGFGFIVVEVPDDKALLEKMLLFLNHMERDFGGRKVHVSLAKGREEKKNG